MKILTGMEHLWRDVWIGARTLSKTPLFTIFAALVLAIGIGANVTVFTFVNAIFFRSLEVPEPQSFVKLQIDGEGPFGIKYPDYIRYRDENQSLSNLAASSWTGPTPVRVDNARGLPLDMFRLNRVSGNFFPATGLHAKLGRLISPEDTQPGSADVVVLSEFCWKRYFDADTNIVGRTIFLNNTAHTIIGVAPDALTTVIEGQLSLLEPSGPLFLLPWKSPGGLGTLIGRLKPTVSKAQAQADFSRIAAQVSSEKKYRVSITVLAGDESPGGTLLRLSFFFSLFMSGVTVVLLIACDNIAILLLSRVAARRREIGIRLALGATRRQLVRQLVAENLMLSIIGGLGAMLAALLSARILENLPFLPVPDAFVMVFDWRVIGFATALSLATTLLFGIRPALQAVGKDVVISLNPGATGKDTHSSIRSTLVVTQVTVCTAMLIAAAVLMRSQTVANEIDKGFVSDHVLMTRINFVGTLYGPQRIAAFYEALLDRLNATPGILSSGVVENVPLVNAMAGMFEFGGFAETARVRGDNNDVEYDVYTNRVTRGHFGTLSIPLLQGRDFTAQDRATSSKVGIINETLARQLWPGEFPLGRRVRLNDGSFVEVVGVAKNSKYRNESEQPQYALYLPITQAPSARANTLLVKTGMQPLAASALVQSKIAEIDPTLLGYGTRTLDQQLEFRLLFYRIASYITGVPGALAFVLGIIGTYGTMSLLVAQRRREIGIRIAIGAKPSEAVSLMLKQGMKWTGVGIGLGVFGGFVSTFWLSRYIERVNWLDPIAFLATSLLVAAIAGTACYLPATRASHVDPMVVLREE
jgi:predicted permease